MPRLPAYMSPMYGADVTDEIREVALKKTAQVMKQLEDIRKQCELPPAALDLVVETYQSVLGAELGREMNEKDKVRRKKMRAKMQQTTPLQPSHRRGIVGSNLAGIPGIDFDPYYDIDDDEE